ncbi:hypothetical protein [Collimonas sp. OK607]|uniref:hypothetical protein n=1 Tax=Collimonas sp. OK607 TaxID=1798194 RepID=UPI00147E550F|nr:hypothetical protein [Collimonas sp. OK607]
MRQQAAMVGAQDFLAKKTMKCLWPLAVLDGYALEATKCGSENFSQARKSPTWLKFQEN